MIVEAQCTGWGGAHKKQNNSAGVAHVEKELRGANAGEADSFGTLDTRTRDVSMDSWCKAGGKPEKHPHLAAALHGNGVASTTFSTRVTTQGDKRDGMHDE
ncbi:hypothetical protein CVT26_015837 [Gymnopilus dilepis]|uniref:Uncharacterized protein n=1 Tax=Gymnopilus dilepis TaxID=231916 RepID=A0A409WHL1_9AGAR|nr:hypothetical protein CVT26_015837 [Gymnopilus dilepis]